MVGQPAGRAFHFAPTPLQLLLMPALQAHQVIPECVPQAAGQTQTPGHFASSSADGQTPPIRLHIAHPGHQQLFQMQAGGKKKIADQTIGPRGMGKHVLDFLRAQERLAQALYRPAIRPSAAQRVRIHGGILS